MVSDSVQRQKIEKDKERKVVKKDKSIGLIIEGVGGSGIDCHL